MSIGALVANEGWSRLLLGAVASLLVTAAAAQGAGHEQRVALVIGNSAYQQAPLANPVNDARDMAARLRTLGFDVTLRENLRTREIGAVYREFRTRITPGAVALFFYAGHGLQVKGQNYFPAVDSDISSEEDVPLQSLNLGTLLDNMEEAKAGVSLVLLDACRDNPFARRFRSASRGLAKVEAASGTLIHYATRPGSVAADGDGRNGTYTEALLAQIGDPGVPVETMLKRVTNRVVASTKGRQEPWVEGSLRGDFYFSPLPATAERPAQDGASASLPRARSAEEIEDAFWDRIKDDREATGYQEYLKQYPSGRYAAHARISIARLQGTGDTSTGGGQALRVDLDRRHKECAEGASRMGNQLLSGATVTATQVLADIPPADAYGRIYRYYLKSASLLIRQNDPQMRVLVAANESSREKTKYTVSVAAKGAGSDVSISFWTAPGIFYDEDVARAELCKMIFSAYGD